MEISEKIKILRNQLKLSQKKFGNELGLSQEAIAGYEVGRREPSLDILQKMVKLAKANKIKFDPFN